MRQKFEPMSRRFAALAILFLLIAGVWLAFIRPLVALISEVDDGVDSSLKLIAGYERAAGVQAGLEARLQELRARDASAVGVLAASTAGVAAANLQGEIKRIIDSQGGEVRSAQAGAVSAVESFEKIETRYELAIPLHALGAVLYQIESHIPYLFFDEITVSAPENWQADIPAAANPKLTVRCTLHAYRRPGAA